jgi:predicted O-methyltransferase YrrM
MTVVFAAEVAAAIREPAQQNVVEWVELVGELRALNPLVGLEVGTADFGSALMLLDLVPSLAWLVTVDSLPRLQQEPWLAERVRPYDDRLYPVVGDFRSGEVVRVVEQALRRKADFAFLDNGKQYGEVLSCFLNAWSLVRKGGVIAIHDIVDWADGRCLRCKHILGGASGSGAGEVPWFLSRLRAWSLLGPVDRTRYNGGLNEAA